TDSVKSATNDEPALPGVEGCVVSGNLYKNQALGMTFQFPPGWVLAQPQDLHALNDRNEVSAKASILQQHPELANSLKLSVPKVIFYASRRGGDGQRIDVPSLRITAVPSRLDAVSLENFQVLVANRATASGLKPTGPASEFQVNKHPFVRADFDRAVGALHVYQSFVQTIAGDYLLTIEIYAYSVDELQQVASSLQSMSITEEDP